MNSCLLIALNVVRRNLRARALWFVLAYGLALGGIVHLSPGWDPEFRDRLVLDASISLLRVLALLAAVFTTLPLYPTERDQQTISVMVAMGLDRPRLMIGLLVGSLLSVGLVTLLQVGVMGVGCWIMAVPPPWGVIRALMLLGWELVMITGLALLCSVMLEFLPGLLVMLAMFVFGNLTYALDTATHDDSWVSSLLSVLQAILPAFHVLDVKDAVLRGDALPLAYDAFGALYALSITATATLLAMWRFDRQELR